MLLACLVTVAKKWLQHERKGCASTSLSVIKPARKAWEVVTLWVFPVVPAEMLQKVDADGKRRRLSRQLAPGTSCSPFVLECSCCSHPGTSKGPYLAVQTQWLQGSARFWAARVAEKLLSAARVKGSPTRRALPDPTNLPVPPPAPLAGKNQRVVRSWALCCALLFICPPFAFVLQTMPSIRAPTLRQRVFMAGDGHLKPNQGVQQKSSLAAFQPMESVGPAPASCKCGGLFRLCWLGNRVVCGQRQEVAME